MNNTLTINSYKLFTSRAYINKLIGTKVAYTTPAGTRVVGTITRNPMSTGISSLAVITNDGRWASLGHNSTVELV
jgi:hypothetical protein